MQQMSARVGASLILALGVSDTIARNLRDMEDILEALIRHPKQARASRRRLEKARFTHPLFDTGILVASSE
jgi:protein O-GlcNAc transferase